MPENKRHHYVPRFYLRNFSSGERRCIGLFNIASGKLVEQASIKDQAYRDYFYGKDLKTENRLAKIEGEADRVIAEIIRTGRPPVRYQTDFGTLCIFIMIQDNRTVKSVTTLNEMAEKLAKALLSRNINDPEMLKHLPDLKLETTHPFSILLRQALVVEPLIHDLRLKVLHNVSGVPFITSDHPVVKHNQLYKRLWCKFWKGHILLVKALSENEHFYAEH